MFSNKNNILFRLCIYIFMINAMFMSNRLNAEIIHPYEPGNKLTAAVLSDVMVDPTTRIYTYTYTVTNLAGSQQELETFSLVTAPGIKIINSTAPKGWDFMIHSDRPMISWVAVDFDPAPAGVVENNEDDVPSSYTIKAGQTLTGFVIQTMTAPDNGSFYARGYTKIPTATSEEDFELMADLPKHFTEDSFSGVTTTPIKDNYLLKENKK